MKTYILDTNCFLRYLLKDVGEQAEAVKALVTKCRRGRVKIAVLVVTIFELNFVLSKVYRFDKELIVENLRTIIHEPSFKVEDKTSLVLALNYYSQNNISFADCFLKAKAITEDMQLFTFDKQLARLK